MEWLKEEITISIQELVEKSKSDGVWDFAEKFISILEVIQSNFLGHNMLF